MSKRLKSLFLLVIVFCLVSASGDKDEKSEKPPEKKITVAVYPITMAGADKSLAAPLTQILIREISQSAMLTVLEESMISEVLKKQGFANSDLCDNTQCQISIGKLTPAQKLVTPALSKLADKFILDLKVTDIQTGVVDFVASKSKICKEDELDQLVAEAALELRAKFGEKLELPHSSPQAPTGAPAMPAASNAPDNLLGLKVKQGIFSAYGSSISAVYIEAISPDSPCSGAVKVGDMLFVINPNGTAIKSENRIFTLQDFNNAVSRIKPGTTVGLRTFGSDGKKPNDAAIKVPAAQSSPAK